MKTALFGLLALTISLSAFAAERGLSSDEAEQAVVRQANAYIARNAPDFGGKVHSPCAADLRGDGLTVTCSGFANETVGGDGSFKSSFTCTGEFSQGEDGLFFQSESIHCE